MGKTNLDPFATGLGDIRTPYPVPCSPRAPGRVPGGSSSGSAVAVSAGPFGLGTVLLAGNTAPA